MGYELYSDHPESTQRRHADFDAWSFWAPKNAPWTGVGIPDMAKLVQRVCTADPASDACQKLDTGGVLTPFQVAHVLQLAGRTMSPKAREVFQHARDNNYGVRVVFSKGLGAVSASEYLAKA